MKNSGNNNIQQNTLQNKQPKQIQRSTNNSSSNANITFSPDNSVGARITFLNILNETIEGEIYAYDPSLDLIALYESGGQHESSRRKTFRLVNTKMITQIIKFDPTLKKTYIPFADLSLPLPPINLSKLQQREEKACYERAQHLGSGVTSEAQQIFDQLSKTLPCRWEEDVIVVMDVVRISSPYDLASVAGGNDTSQMRVKRVLQGELEKLQRKM